MITYKLIRLYDGEIITQHFGQGDLFKSKEDALFRVREFIAYSSHADVHEIAKPIPEIDEFGNTCVHITDQQRYVIIPIQISETDWRHYFEKDSE